MFSGGLLDRRAGGADRDCLDIEAVEANVQSGCRRPGGRYGEADRSTSEPTIKNLLEESDGDVHQVWSPWMLRVQQLQLDRVVREAMRGCLNLLFLRTLLAVS